jgi:hypothetical protein
LHEGDITTKSHECDTTTKSHEGEIKMKSHEGETTTKPHEGDKTTKSHGDVITKESRSEAPPLDKQQISHSLWLLSGSFFTIYPMQISSSKIIFHSLRPIPVEGEYCLSTKDLCIHWEIAPGAADKICTASLLTDPPSRLVDLKSGVPTMSVIESLLPSRLERLLVFSIGLVDLLPWIEALRTCTTKVSSRDGLSNLPMSGHNSPTLGLESSRVAIITSAPSELGLEEKMDKLQELDFSTASPLGVST